MYMLCQLILDSVFMPAKVDRDCLLHHSVRDYVNSHLPVALIINSAAHFDP